MSVTLSLSLQSLDEKLFFLIRPIFSLQIMAQSLNVEVLSLTKDLYWQLRIV